MKKIIFYIAISIFIIGCKSDKKKSEDVKTASFIQEWFPNANYAGELLAMYEFDTKEGIDITIQAGSYDIDPIKMVISGSNDFGIVSADRLLEANEKGADLRAIAIANYKTPTCFISRKTVNLDSLNDFNGKRVGILTGTNTEIIYNLLKKKGNINPSSEIEIPFDLNTFLLGEYDIRPAFTYDEPVSLELQNIDYNILHPEDFDIHFLGTVYFCRAELIEKKPDLVKSFVAALKNGWLEVFENPEKGIEYLKKYDPEIDANREKISLQKAIPYFKGENDNILWASEETWDNTAKILIDAGKIKSFNFDDNVNYSFLYD